MGGLGNSLRSTQYVFDRRASRLLTSFRRSTVSSCFTCCRCRSLVLPRRRWRPLQQYGSLGFYLVLPFPNASVTFILTMPCFFLFTAMVLARPFRPSTTPDTTSASTHWHSWALPRSQSAIPACPSSQQAYQPASRSLPPCSFSKCLAVADSPCSWP